MFSHFETIAAISTAIGQGGIGIVRISGKESLNILNKIFVPINKNAKIKSHKLIYGHIFDNDTIIDEVLISYMKSPKTYTKEDIVEINCHGGIISLKKILETVLKNGARIAEKGEFTKRAFLNGRIDLLEAEAVIDLINAKTSLSHQISINQLEGKLSNKINELRKNLLKMIANIEASIDYPEHDMEKINIDLIKDESKEIILDLDYLLETSESGQLIKDGIETVILGKPNVGKSSLLNALLNEERAIVTDIPGTTRDILKESINIDGIPLNLIDTAGIRETDNQIEKIGVKKSLEYSNRADLILYVIDISMNIDKVEIDFLKSLKEKNIIVLLNKSDLKEIVDINLIQSMFPNNIIKTSVKNDLGFDLLKNKIKEMFFREEIILSKDFFIINIRHKNSLLNAKKSLENVILAIKDGFSEDFLTIDLKDTYNYLGEVIGETLEDDIIDKIFKDFCLGK